ncbi:hypothetical protein B566_EDAN008449 [Ephemera danica]|nr:hypothetical protein B566_EDAN008449 [Ephemera danica]
MTPHARLYRKDQREHHCLESGESLLLSTHAICSRLAVVVWAQAAQASASGSGCRTLSSD